MIKELESYNFNESLQRISAILDTPEQEGEIELKVPSEDAMATYHQRKVYCTVLAIRTSFMAIDEKDNNSFVAMKVLAAYTTEIVAILRGCAGCKDFSMVKDTIVAIFETPFKVNIQSVVDAMSRIHTLRMVIEKKASTPAGGLNVKMGMHFGTCEAYYIGERISPQPSVLWRGQAIASALKLLEKRTNGPSLMMITPTLYNNLNEDYQKFFTQDIWDDKKVYVANMYNVQMNKWLTEH